MIELGNGMRFASTEEFDAWLDERDGRQMDDLAKKEYIAQGVVHFHHAYAEVEGVPNGSADAIPRHNETWSDCNLDRRFKEKKKFDRLICRKCGSTQFEVLSTGSYETTAHCACGMYYVVHTG